jgi:hypothetical protein
MRKRALVPKRRQGRWIVRGENQSVTAEVSDALARGIPPDTPPEEPLPGPEAEIERLGDPDVDPLQNESAGEESPGATTPTPDQNLIDETGRAYGIAEADSGELRTSGELLDARDAARDPKPKPKGRHRL